MLRHRDFRNFPVSNISGGLLIVLKIFVLKKHLLCTEARKEGMFFNYRSFLFTPICSLVRTARISVKYFGRSIQEFFSRLLAVNHFFPAKFSLSWFYVILLDLPHPPLHTFPNGPSLTGVVFILAERAPTLHLIVCWGGSFRDQSKEP